MLKPDTNNKTIENIVHDDDTRTNIPTAEHEAVLTEEQRNPIRVAYERRNPDLDPQLVWRGKDCADWTDLVVQAPPLYIQEKVNPKALLDDLRRPKTESAGQTLDLFADFDRAAEPFDRTDFYHHDQRWTNRMILGDSLQVMATLAEREGLRGKVQCIYIDPPYGIKFNSNFQWSTNSRDVKDGNPDHITREPEQVKAFRDTWRDGIHSYLTYLRDRLTVARDLLTESGSIFVQIGDENVHRVRAVMDEVFGEENACAQILFVKTSTLGSDKLSPVGDHILWYAKNASSVKCRPLFTVKEAGEEGAASYTSVELSDGRRGRLATFGLELGKSLPTGARIFATTDVRSQSGGEKSAFAVKMAGKEYKPSPGFWKTSKEGFDKLIAANRLVDSAGTLRYLRYIDDFPVVPHNALWRDTATGSFTEDKIYVVQTNVKVIQRCILMATDPGDLVLDPTCGSGTTATVAEQWGRRWITIDTSRVALALARARIMGARYPYYLLADSPEGLRKEAEVTQTVAASRPTHGSIRQGFVYERVPHITLKSIANNSEIDTIWEKWQLTLEPLRERINAALGVAWEEWQIPRDLSEAHADALRARAGSPAEMRPLAALRELPAAACALHAAWWQARIGRQKEIDASIAARAEFEYLYDKPYEDKKTVRVAGPFTVESLLPHRSLIADDEGEFAQAVSEEAGTYDAHQSFPEMIIENLRKAGVQQAHKDDKIDFLSLEPWPGNSICAEGRYASDTPDAPPKRAAVFIGPEFGTVARPDIAEAAREAAESGFDVLIACAFNYDAPASDMNKLGKIPIMKARMNADLHMADDLKNDGKGNLFVVFGEPDIDLRTLPDGRFQVEICGVDVYKPNTGEVQSDGPDGIACWFLDTDYNAESFFVRHAYFLGANDPYGALKRTLKAEIDEEAWESLHSAVSRPFEAPAGGRIAVKVINHLGDEVMKVFRV